MILYGWSVVIIAITPIAIKKLTLRVVTFILWEHGNYVVLSVYTVGTTVLCIVSLL